MKKRLTVSIDEEIYERAKAVAEKRGNTLSKSVEGYFFYLRFKLQAERRAKLEEMPPLTRALIKKLEEHDGKEYLRYLDEHYR